MGEYFFGITDKGKRRQKNEDTFIAREISNGEFLVACVIDGVGGYSGGEVAAEIARSVILENLRNLSGNIIETLQHAIIAANGKINEEKEKEGKNIQMACVITCAIADIKNNKLYYAHVGDTRLYLFRDQSLVKISKDHSTVGFLEESGRLSEEDAMRHPRRNEINRALGFEENIAEMNDFIETGESPFLPGDLVLVCSDGLTDMIGSNKISSILLKKGSLASKAKQLVDAANDAGGNDNITAVLVENNKKPQQRVAAKPAERKGQAANPAIPVKNIEQLKNASTSKKNNQGLITFLTLLSVGLLGALMIVLFQKNSKAVNRNPVIAQTAKPASQSMMQLLTHVNDSSKLYELENADSVIQLSDPVLISKDSFRLMGNGVRIVADPSYRGPALIIDPSTKQVILDSIVFENFDIALLLQKNNVILRNVRFIHCRAAVQYSLLFPDSMVSGKLKDSIFINHSTNK